MAKNIVLELGGEFKCLRCFKNLKRFGTYQAVLIVILLLISIRPTLYRRIKMRRIQFE